MACKVRWRRLTTQVAIMSLVFQALVAALMLQPHAAIARGATFAAPAFVICTSHGFKAVTFDADGKPAEVPRSTQYCPICDGIATSAFLLEMGQTALIGRLANPQVLWPANEVRPSSISCLVNRNRGPPGDFSA
jgi:hypothetical protein